MSEHSMLMSPSSGKLWTVCTAMPQAVIDSGIVDTGGHAASRGELQHSYAELIKKGKVAVDGLCPPDLEEDEWDEVQTAVQMADESLPLSPSAKVYLEMRVAFPEKWRESCFGTGDIVAVDFAAGMIHVRDYKFGRVFVEPEGNVQMLIYAIAVIRMLMSKKVDVIQRFHTVTVAVIQPKHRRSFRVWEISVKDILAWEENILIPAQREITEGRGKFVPGNHCVDGYCKLRDRCPAVAQQTIKYMEDFKETIKNTDVKYFSELDFDSEEIRRILKNYYFVKNVVETVYESALAFARQGGKITDFKLVAGQGGRRNWKDKKRAENYLKELGLSNEELYGTSLVGVQAAKKVASLSPKYREETFNRLYEWSNSAPKLVNSNVHGEEVPPDMIPLDPDVEDLLDGIE